MAREHASGGAGREGLRVFPISLLIEGRPCLVVGGGTIAAHKTDLLLEAGARVTVVSPRTGRRISALAADGRISHISRRFDQQDVRGMFLVFAATDDPEVNRSVLACCREHGVLSCSADASWREGQFVTPAILRTGDLTVSVSTGGRSCSRSRQVKERLAEFLRAL